MVADDDIKDLAAIKDPEKKKKAEAENANHTKKNTALKDFVPAAQMFWMIPNIEAVMGINENTDNKIKQAMEYLKAKKGKDDIAAEMKKNDAKYFSVGHEYMLVYFKSAATMNERGTILRMTKEGVEEVKAEFERLRELFNDDWSKVNEGLKALYGSWDKDDPRKS